MAAIAAGVTGCGGNKLERAVAHVGEAPITHQQLDATIDHFREEAEGKPFPDSGSAAYRTVERQALGLLVYRSELEQSAARMGVEVTGAELERRTSAAGGEEAETGGGFARATLRAQIAYEHVYRKITARLPPGRREAAMRRWLDRMSRSFRVTYERGYAPRA